MPTVKTRIQALAGQATPYESSTDTVLDGTNATLVTRGGEEGWQLTGEVVHDFANFTCSQGTMDDGVTMILRYWIDDWVGSSFNKIAAANATSGDGFHIERDGTSSGMQYQFSTTTRTELAGTTAEGVMHTLVVRVHVDSGSSLGRFDSWQDTVGRVGTDPDKTSGGINWSSRTLDVFKLYAPDGTDITFFDAILIEGELTDAECAAAADDLRTAYPAIAQSGGNTAPVADADDDQSVTVGATVTLDGSGSSDADLDTITYLWELTSIPSGSSATLSSTTAESPTFTADLAGDYVASLVVNDGTEDSAADTVTITASAASGTITETIVNNVDALQVSQTAITANVYDATTHELVVSVTGETTDASGVITFSDASIVAATEYVLVLMQGATAIGVSKVTAS